MGKRIWALISALVMFVSALPVFVSDGELSKNQKCRQLGAVSVEEEIAFERAEAAATDLIADLAISDPKKENESYVGTTRAADVNGNELSSDFYFYRGLLSGNQRDLYDSIVSTVATRDCLVHLNSEVERSDIHDAVCAVMYDHPELFWLKASYMSYIDGDGSVVAIELEPSMSIRMVENAQLALDRSTHWILSYASSLSDDAQKVKAVHDYILHTVDYEENEYDQSAFGALVGKKAVCAGYSRAYQYCLQKLHIPAAVITGPYHDQYHMWNIVRLDGEYYVTDVTWDDPPGNPVNEYHYDFFNLTDQQMDEHHPRDGLCTGLQSANGTRYVASYFGSRGTDFSQYDALSGSVAETTQPPDPMAVLPPNPVSPTATPPSVDPGTMPVQPPEPMPTTSTPQPSATPSPTPQHSVAPSPTPQASAEAGRGQLYYTAAEDGGLMLTSTTCIGSVRIPNDYNGRKVTAIGEGAFADHQDITDIELPEGLVQIGDGAFARSGIERISVPDGVTEIGEGAFEDCKALVSASLPSTTAFQSISPRTFKGCTALKRIEIPSSVTRIGENAFRGCSELETVGMRNTLRVVEEGAFSDCSALARVHFYGTPTEFQNISIANTDSNKCMLLVARIRCIYTVSEDTVFDSDTRITAGVWILSGSKLRAEQFNGHQIVVMPTNDPISSRHIVGMRASEVTASFKTDDGIECTVLSAGGLKLGAEDLVSTGCLVRFVGTNGVVWEAEVAVPGDVLGTGQATVSQLVQMAKALVGKVNLVGVYLRSADVDGNGVYSISDLIHMARLIKA